MVFIVMGVSGAGKTTVGKLLADRLALPFHDADDFHPESNLAKMRQGVPLTDEERMPWLERLAREISGWNASQGAVLACSALKESYRRILRGGGEVHFIHLHGTHELLEKRMKERKGHYFPAHLLESQLRDLEVPDHALSVEIGPPPEEICEGIMQGLRARGVLD